MRRLESKEKEKIRIVQLKEEVTENQFVLQETNAEIRSCEEQMAQNAEQLKELQAELETLRMVVNENIRANMTNLESDIAQVEREIENTKRPIR